MNNIQPPVYEILRVEDSEDDIILTEEAFKECGFALRVHEVADGEEALHFLRREGAHQDAPRPHLIILALNLSRKSGLSVLREIKTDERSKDISVVVSSSRMDRDVKSSYQNYAHCKRIRNDKGFWEQWETYISLHSQAQFSHSICPECAKSMYGMDLSDLNPQDTGSTPVATA